LSVLDTDNPTTDRPRGRAGARIGARRRRARL